jgi:ubiquinone/menaquinone biosynthesis C-methylase UbiE
VGIYGRIFAFLYDPFLWFAERRGMADRRGRLLGAASGRVLEIGAGTGLNVQHYGDAVSELILTEPDRLLLPRLERRLLASRHVGVVVHASAESLPFADASFDTVVSTLVLCTVDDPRKCLTEIHRVLTPKGELLFLEHVRAPDGSRLQRWQNRLHDPWRAFAYGCHCNRDTLDLLQRERFAIGELQRGKWVGMPALVGPLISGRARQVR